MMSTLLNYAPDRQRTARCFSLRKLK